MQVQSQINNCTLMNPALDSVGNPTCKTCANGTLLTYSGYECLACASPCASCYGLPTICMSCVAGYRYDAAKHTCTACADGTKTCYANETAISCFPFYFMSTRRNICRA